MKIILCVALVLGVSPVHAGDAFLTELIEELKTHNPVYLETQAELRAAAARVPQAASLEDPIVRVEAMDIATKNPDRERTPMDGVQVELMQEFPLPGTLGLRRKIAESQRLQARLVQEETLTELVAQVKSAYYDYAYAEDALALYTRSKSELQSMATMMRSTYSTGEATQSELLAARAEVSMMEGAILEARTWQRSSGARLNQLLSRPSGTAFERPNAPLVLTQLAYTLPELEQLARTHPRLESAQRGVEQAEFKRRLAKRELLPEFGLSVAYRMRAYDSMEAMESENFLSTGIEFSLPLWAPRKQVKMIQEATHMTQAERYRRDATQQEIVATLAERYSELDEMRAQYALYHSRIVPELRAAAASTRRRYEAGLADYDGLIADRLALLKQELMGIKLGYEHEKAVAELEMAVGQALDNRGERP